MTEKFILLAFLFGGVLIYAVLDPRPNARFDFHSDFDGLVPFLPSFIYPYFGLFIFIPLAILLLAFSVLAKPYLLALDIAMYTGAVVWYFFPAKMHHPHVSGQTLSERLTLLLYRGDPHANALPSAHVFSAVISAHFLSREFPAFMPVIWFIGFLIAVSTMFVKRHSVADVSFGVLWAIGATLVSRTFINL